METIDIEQALGHIRELLESASEGTEIIITKNQQPLVKLVPIKTSKPRPSLFGSDKDIISLSPDFDDPLDDFKEYT